ncbi:hypothetical protein [Gilliamella sp. Occ4-3]|uniref:hypothetical protein n=1 Tax=Gilliamella sp. Occ4-3 TaxID=3120254 RepID=UPI00117BC23F|nr:hypothetical protein [Gilliamella apicola]
MALAPLLLLPYSLESQALSATTSERIHGTAPYLTIDGGVTKVTEIRELLGIKLSDGRTFTPQNNPSSPTALIKLPNVGDTLADIEMIVPPSSDSININDLVTQGKWGDDDGDGQGVNGVVASGSISVSFTDKDGSAVSRGDALDICKAPYKVTLSSTEGNLATQYGEPRSSTFSGGTAEYYITLPSQPVICAVRPNLLLGGTTGLDWDDPRFAGPANIWDPAKGFLVQSTNPSSYDQNFPTTGADRLYFDLDIGGIDASQLRWTVNTSGSLNATVAWRLPNQGTNEDRWITDKSKYVTRVTLNGPRASSSQISSSNPGQITVPSLPQRFELVGRDSSGNEVRYGFELRQWFVHRADKRFSVSEQAAWCRSLGYHLSRVNEVTNAVCSGVGVNPAFPCTGAVGATPPSSGNHYQRQIGAGLFTEWGYMNNYADAGFLYFDHWTSDAIGGDKHFAVNSNDGYVDSNKDFLDRYGICSTP